MLEQYTHYIDLSGKTVCISLHYANLLTVLSVGRRIVSEHVGLR